jgi:chromosome partitioning protein
LLETLQLPERVAGMAHLEARHLWFERISAYYASLATNGRGL